MSRPQLFQLVEPNNSGVTTLATFQTQDRPHIENRKGNIETELRAIVSSEDLDKLFISVVDGIWSGGITKNKGGKIIPTKPPSQHTQQHLSQISSRLQSLPKKCTDTHNSNQISMPNPRHHYVIAGMPTIPHMSQEDQTPPIPVPNSTFAAQLDRRFSLIEGTIQKHQEYNEAFHHRLLTLEQTTQNTDTKIDLILNKMESITNPPKHRKASFHPESLEHDYEMNENNHPNSHHQSQHNGCSQQCVL
jgi:hypothetical protein